MEKTGEKSMQILQPRWQTFFKSMQDLLWVNSWDSLVSSPLRLLPGLANIQHIARRHWFRRLPAVTSAAILLFAFMTIFNIGKEVLVLTSFIALAGLSCFAVMEGIR